METLFTYFPKDRYRILVEKDKDVVKMLLKSKMSCNWVQEKIGNTGYFQLSRFTNTKGFNVVIVCKNNLIND